MISPSGDTSILVDGKFRYYKHVNFLQINLNLKQFLSESHLGILNLANLI